MKLYEIYTSIQGETQHAGRPCTLVRFAADNHFLLWSVPDLHLDGWSWPIVFSEVNASFTARGSCEAINATGRDNDLNHLASAS